MHDTGKAVGARPHSEASAVFAQRAAAAAAARRRSSASRSSCSSIITSRSRTSRSSGISMIPRRSWSSGASSATRRISTRSCCSRSPMARARARKAGRIGRRRSSGSSIIARRNISPIRPASSRNSRSSATRLQAAVAHRSCRPTSLKRSKRISSSCRTIISAPSASTRSSRTRSSSGGFCSEPLHRERPAAPPDHQLAAASAERPQHSDAFARGTGTSSSRRSPDRSRSCR